MSLRRTASSLALLLLAACASDGCVASNVIDFPDWSLIEPDHPRIATSGATTLDAGICIDRIDAVSVGYSNAVTALTLINDLPGVNIATTVRAIDCGGSDSTLWASPPQTDIVVAKVTDTCMGGALNATAGVCYYKAGGSGPLWTISDCAQIAGCEATSAVIMLRESDYQGNDEPSIGVVSHELGHAFGLVHGYWTADDCTTGVTPPQVRAVAQQHFQSHTVVRGSGRGVTAGDDNRTGRVSAYTLGYLQARYPSAAVTYATPEWYAHEMVIVRDTTCLNEDPVTPESTWEFRDFRPDSLCLDGATQQFRDCATDQNVQ